MGSRGSKGSSGGKSGGRSGRDKVAALKLPTLAGSEKQVSWATDILRTPYELMGKNAEIKQKQAAAFDKASTNGTGGDNERNEAAALRAAQTRYAKEISSLPGMEAKTIIDKRAGIKDIANNILKDEYKKRKLSLFGALRV